MSNSQLNPAQREAIEHQSGPLLVLAGAGSGKTRVITHRIARLLERGVPAQAIVALTFTNKAAGEMNERVRALLGKPAARPSRRPNAQAGGAASRAVTIATFHSFGLGVLTRERAATGGAFTIFDQGDCLGAVKEVMRSIDGGKRFDAAAIMARISNAKNAFVDPDAMVEREGDEYDEITKIVYPRYVAALRSFRAYDFDDLVCEVARLWTRRADILARSQERYRYILVDEYQDTNRAQLELLRLLAAPHKNICVVGDDDQAIYAWRGADVRNILEFEDHFPGAKVVKLEQNYRSRAPIIAVANAVIAKRVDTKHRKVLFTARGGDEKVHVVISPTPEIEASYAAKEIQRRIREEGQRASALAVLYRSNGQSKAMEEALRERGVAHRVLGGQQFFERKEVKDLLAYLKFVLNPADEISLRRVINYPARGIGETSVEKLGVHALARGWSLWQAVERVDALDDVSAAACEGCKRLERLVAETRADLEAHKGNPSVAVRGLGERLGLKGEIDASSPTPQAAARRWANVEGLFATFARREARELAEPKARADGGSWLATFLQALTLNADDEAKESGELVTLCTLHGAKGLEFDTVFLLGCEEGLLPHARTIDARATDANAQDIEEERRLFYVGVTRARESLFLSRCRTRAQRGKLVPRTPSRFLLDVPSELVVEIDVKEDPSTTTASMEQSASALLAALDALR